MTFLGSISFSTGSAITVLLIVALIQLPSRTQAFSTLRLPLSSHTLFGRSRTTAQSPWCSTKITRRGLCSIPAQSLAALGLSPALASSSSDKNTIRMMDARDGQYADAQRNAEDSMANSDAPLGYRDLEVVVAGVRVPLRWVADDACAKKQSWKKNVTRKRRGVSQLYDTHSTMSCLLHDCFKAGVEREYSSFGIREWVVMSSMRMSVVMLLYPQCSASA